MKMTGLDHITVNVKDLDRSKAFYGDVLGLKEAGFVQMGDHTLTYYELPQGVRLELIDYVTWNHGVGQDGNQSFTGRVDNPAADNTGSVTAEAHSHEWSLMPVPVSFLLPAGSAF